MQPAGGLFRRTSTYVWLAGYVALIAGVVLAMFAVRDRTLAALDTPEARAQWQTWREAPPNVSKDYPVKRRPPSTTEPPGLILMREHFGVMLAGAVIFSSLLFVATMVAARGVFSGRKIEPDPRQ